jgi:predicted component of type VI protein secretion system
MQAPAAKQNEHWKLIAIGDWLAGTEYNINKTVIVGRDPGCDITIAGTHLSRKHAQISPQAGGLKIQDLNSSNGTYVNGSRITEQVIRDGDELTFDVLRFRAQAPFSADDGNKTVLRAAPLPKTVISPATQATNTPGTTNKTGQPSNQAASTANAQKQWKTKPTSNGNRDPKDEIQAQLKGPQAWVYYLVAISIAAGVVGYLFYSIQG